MSADEALQLFGKLKGTLGLDGGQSSTVLAAPQTPAANRIIDKYLDRHGITHLNDDLNSIPEEYRSKVQKRAEKPLPPPSGPSSSHTTSVVSPTLPVPSPELLDSYYAEEGPPVVTYYPPPEPYGYLYGWVPYSFWSSGFLYPGFFILRDFHRHVMVGGRPFLVTNHVGFGYSRRGFRVEPDQHVLQPQLTSPQVSASARVQASARAIIAQDRSHFAGPPVQSGPNGPVAPWPAPAAPRGLAPCLRHSPPWGTAVGVTRCPQAGASSVVPPTFHGRNFLQFPAPGFRSPAFPQGGGNFQGGFPRTGGGFVGFRGGGARGGRR